LRYAGCDFAGREAGSSLKGGNAMLSRAGILLSWSIALLALLGIAVDLPVQGASLIGCSLNLPERAPESDLYKIACEERSDGLKLVYTNAKWSNLEPRPGQYNLKNMDFKNFETLGFKVLLTIQTIDTPHRTLPSDLMDVPFDSPVMQARFDALLKAIAAKLRPNVCWVSLGNEVDVYLSKHESELEPYAKFVERGRDVLRLQCPQLAVGVTTTNGGARDRPGIAARLNRKMDVVCMNYYPLEASWRARPVFGLDADFALMIQTAGTKPLLLQEYGCPADPSISSEDLQAAYVDGLFRNLKKYGDRVAGANWFLYCDFNSAFVNELIGYYLKGSKYVETPNFRAYLSSMGLKRANGTARKSWEVFRTRARAWSAQ